jgi:hypothetical protein
LYCATGKNNYLKKYISGLAVKVNFNRAGSTVNLLCGQLSIIGLSCTARTREASGVARPVCQLLSSFGSGAFLVTQGLCRFRLRGIRYVHFLLCSALLSLNYEQEISLFIKVLTMMRNSQD